MDIFLNALLLIGCFVVLIKGADFMVDSASFIAKALKVPAVVIGLTIVAFGTSAPEAGVSIASSLSGQNSLSISNVVGSNCFNLLVVVGLCAAIRSMNIDKDIKKRDYPICIGFSALLCLFVFDKTISRVEGLIFFALIVGYCVLLIAVTMNGNNIKDSVTSESADDKDDKETGKVKPGKIIFHLLVVVASITAIYFSSKGIVYSCSFFAKLLGISDTIIGLTIVALGTSLPELVTSIVASRKGENGIALGNVVGSNIFNITFVLGIAAAISPLSINSENIIDAFICLALTAVCALFIFTGKKVKRGEGVAMLLMYAAYMVFVFMREFGALPF